MRMSRKFQEGKRSKFSNFQAYIEWKNYFRQKRNNIVSYFDLGTIRQFFSRRADLFSFHHRDTKGVSFFDQILISHREYRSIVTRFVTNSPITIRFAKTTSSDRFVLPSQIDHNNAERNHRGYERRIRGGIDAS